MILARPWPHPRLPIRQVKALELSDEQARALLDRLAPLAELGSEQGRRHRQPSLLALAVCAFISGARSSKQMARWAGQASDPLLRALRCRRDARTQRFVPPSEPTFRRLLAKRPLEPLETLLGDWLQPVAQGGIGINTGADHPSFTVAVLIERISAAFQGLPDNRGKSNNQRYLMQDAALSGFAVFFTQSPSFLDHQTRMQQEQGRNNAQTLFGVHQIPCDNQIRNLLDPVPPQTLFPLMASIGDELYRNGYLEALRSLNKTFLLALDGTDFFSSHKIHCACCHRSTQKNGDTLYRHIAVTPLLVAPGQEKVIALAPEFVQPQDGHDKQDCELAAGARWLTQWGAHYAPWRITLLGDDLYCHQPFCQQVLAANMAFLFTCKPDSHRALYEWIADFSRNNQLSTLVRTRWTGKKRLSDTYRYANQVPLRDSDDALMVGWCELITTDEQGKVLYRNAWASSHRIDERNVELVVKAGRARWKIENEGNNTLKTKGYHFEHNFGHGQQHLANLLATMILLAFLVHTTLDWMDERYRAVRQALPSRRTFFEHVRALLQYLPFDDWNHLMAFMLSKLSPPDTG